MSNFADLIKNITVQFNDKIKRFCDPLIKHFNLNCFWYRKISDSGRCIYLSNHAEWSEYFVAEKLYLTCPYYRHPNQFYSGVDLMRPVEQVSLKESFDNSGFARIMSAGREKFNVHSSLQLMHRTSAGIEAFGFSCDSSDEMSHMRFVNELPLLRMFVKNFKNEQRQLLNLLDDHAIDLAALLGPRFYEPSIAKMPKPVSRRAFLKQVGNVHLSKMETKVIRELLNGYSAAQVADRLTLSTRTVEHYIENIKIKLSCSSKSDLIQRARELEFLGYFTP